MKAIYKYLVPIKDVFTVDMPDGAAVLSVQVQFGEPKMWALVDNSRPTTTRTFRVIGTGHLISYSGPMKFIGTFQLHGGELVFHLFEVL